MRSFSIDLNDFKNHRVVIDATKKFGVSLKAFVRVIEASEGENVVYAVTKELKVHRLVKKLIRSQLISSYRPPKHVGDWVCDKKEGDDKAKFVKQDVSYELLDKEDPEDQEPLAPRTPEQQRQVKVICVAVKKFAREYKEFLSILDQCDADLCVNLMKNKIAVNLHLCYHLDSYFRNRREKDKESWTSEMPDDLRKMLRFMEVETKKEEKVAEKQTDEDDCTVLKSVATADKKPIADKDYPMCPLKAADMFKKGDFCLKRKILEIKNENAANRLHALRSVLNELEDYEPTVKMLKEEGKLKEEDKDPLFDFGPRY